VDGSFRIHSCFPPAGEAPYCTPDKNYKLPQPYWGENDPVACMDCAIIAQGQERNKNQKTGINNKFPA